MKILNLIISVLLSVVSGFVSACFGFDPFQSIATAFFVFLACELISITWFISGVYFRQKKENQFLNKITPYNTKLQEINEFLYNVLLNSHGDDDLFVITCTKAIENLYSLFKDASDEQRVEITSDYIINVKGVFEALNMTKNKTIKLTFPIKKINGSIIPSAEDRKFFETIYKKIISHEVSQLEILVILDDSSMLNDDQLNKLFDFYKSNINYYCKYTFATDFIEACNNNMVPTTSLDFGIYGPKMLFVVEGLSPYKGVYYKDEIKISRYTELFDEVWNFESITFDNPSLIGTGSPITPKQFFENINSI